MPVISPQDRQTLEERFRKELKRKITLRLFTSQLAGQLFVPGRECPTCPQTQQILEELASLSPLLELEMVDFYSQSQTARESGVEAHSRDSGDQGAKTPASSTTECHRGTNLSPSSKAQSRCPSPGPL